MTFREFSLSLVSGVLGGIIVFAIENTVLTTTRWWIRLLTLCSFLTIAALVLLYFGGRPAPAAPGLADFDGCRPVNQYGRLWENLSDNEYGGNSTVTISTPST